MNKKTKNTTFHIIFTNQMCNDISWSVFPYVRVVPFLMIDQAYPVHIWKDWYGCNKILYYWKPILSLSFVSVVFYAIVTSMKTMDWWAINLEMCRSESIQRLGLKASKWFVKVCIRKWTAARFAKVHIQEYSLESWHTKFSRYVLFINQSFHMSE